MTDEAAGLLGQAAVLEMEISARALLHSITICELAKYINARKAECGFSPGSVSAEKWEQLEKSASVGTIVEILDFLAESEKSIPAFIETWELHGDLRLALRVLARSTPVAAPRFNPAHN